MKVTLVRPRIGRLEAAPYRTATPMEPLEIAVLAGLTPVEVELRFFDDRIEEVDFDEPTDLVGITVETYTARRTYEIAAAYRARGVPVILGGFHATLLPAECAEHADAVYIGDAEFRWHEVIEDARAGNLKPEYRAPANAPQRGGLMPRREIYGNRNYLPLTLLQFSRGCRYRCSFCAIAAFFNSQHNVRSTEDVLAEIAGHEQRILFFIDDNFLSDHEAAKRFLRRLIPLNVRWVSQASIDMADDSELMDLLEASGCLGNVVGFESLNPDALAALRKGHNLTHGGLERFARQCQVLRAHGLQTWASFILGTDFDTVQSIRETVDFAIEQKFCFAAFNVLMPYPGTPLYQQLDNENRLLFDRKWWLHPDYRFNHAAFLPKHMSPEDLTEASWYCRDKWNSAGSIFKRFWDPKTHLSSWLRAGIYLHYNMLARRESRRKQDMLFGVS